MKMILIRLAFVVGIMLFASVALKAQQPFSNVSASPTTSPYLSLTNNGRSNGFAAYQNFVLPQLQQQQVNQQQAQQIQHLQQQQQKSLVGGLPGQPQRGISTEIRGTGHITTFMDYLHYYPRPGGLAQAPRQ